MVTPTRRVSDRKYSCALRLKKSYGHEGQTSIARKWHLRYVGRSVQKAPPEEDSKQDYPNVIGLLFGEEKHRDLRRPRNFRPMVEDLLDEPFACVIASPHSP